MKSISLCVKVHFPVIYHKHPFSEIAITDEYLDSYKTEQHVKQLSANKLVPFLESTLNLSRVFGENFKLALSISGISIKLLQKHAPQTLEFIRSLSDKKIIEFFAEPWSNSIVPFFSEKELVIQTELHKKAIQTTFEQTPKVFISNSAINPEIFSQFDPLPGHKSIFTTSNHLPTRLKNRKEKTTTPTPKAQFLINHTLSTKFQHAVSDASTENGQAMVAPFIRYLRKHVSLVKPLILVFNPLAKNLTSYNKWEAAISWLFKNTNSSFYSLTDLAEVANYFSIENDYSDALLSQFRQPDYWLKNNMQQEAFRQFRNTYKLVRSGEYPFIPEAWDYLQDINNFFYMSDSFFLNDFNNQHFNPYRSPHEAFTSYMNAASNFWNIKKNIHNNYFKTNFLYAPTIN